MSALISTVMYVQCTTGFTVSRLFSFENQQNHARFDFCEKRPTDRIIIFIVTSDVA